MKIITNDSALEALGAMEPSRLTDLLGQEAGRMAGYDQNNPHHCYDLLTHTLRTVGGVRREALPDEDAFGETRAAALFHDIGKPDAARDKNGRTVFYGHAALSAAMARPLLAGMGFDGDETDRIAFLIAHHDDFISLRMPGEWVSRKYGHVIGAATVRDKCRELFAAAEAVGLGAEAYRLWDELTALCRADAAAQAKETRMNGRRIDTRADKIRRIEAIRSLAAAEFSVLNA